MNNSGSESTESLIDKEINHTRINITNRPLLEIPISVTSKEGTTGSFYASDEGACHQSCSNNSTNVGAKNDLIVKVGMSNVISQDNSKINAYNYTPNSTTLDLTVCGITSNIVESSNCVCQHGSNSHTRLVRWCSTENRSHTDKLFVEELSKGNLNVWLRELPDSERVLLVVTKKCIFGTCLCQHLIGGRPAQLRPCGLFVELCFRGNSVPDWFYLLWGLFFGFRVIDSECMSIKLGKFDN